MHCVYLVIEPASYDGFHPGFLKKTLSSKNNFRLKMFFESFTSRYSISNIVRKQPILALINSTELDPTSWMYATQDAPQTLLRKPDY